MSKQPNKFNKLIATAAGTAVVVSAIAPVAGAEWTNTPNWMKDSLQDLVNYGVIDANSTVNAAGEVTRGEVALYFAKALKLDLENVENPGFADVSTSHKYYNAIAALANAGKMNGTQKGFEPDRVINRAEMASLIVKAFGYEYGNGANLTFTDLKGADWAKNAIAGLTDAGIKLGVNDTQFAPLSKLTRQDTVGFLWKVMKDQGTDFAAYEKVQVESVNEINAKTIEMNFSSAINTDTLKDASKQNVITVIAGEGATNAGAITQTLSEDGKSLTLTAANYFKGDYTVKVPFEIVKGTNGKYLAPSNTKVTVNDNAAPVLSSATATVKTTDDKITSVTLTFNEDVKSVDVVKIGGQNYTATPIGKTVTISNLNLDATKDYDITVVNAKDIVDNIKDVQTSSLNITVDNVAPAITNVEATGENTVKITVDKALQNNALAITGKVGTFESNIVQSAIVNAENNKEYIVTLNSAYLYKNGNSENVTLKFAKEALVDTIGNKNADDITKTVVVSKDVAAPTVTNVETTVNNGKVTAFTLNFNEEVKSVDASKVHVVNAKGEILTLASIATAAVKADDNTKVVFTLANGIQADQYSFDLSEGFVMDKALAANKSGSYSFTVNVTDADQPVETSFTITDVTEDNNIVTVAFGQKVKATGTGSALNPLAYSVNGVVLPTDAIVEFGKTNDVLDQSKVIITLPEGFVKANDTAAVFRVSGVQTLDNKVSNPFIKTIDITDNTAPELISLVATDLTKLTLSYSEAIQLTAAEATITDEIALTDSKGATINFTAAVVDGKLILTVADATQVSKVTTLKVTDLANANIIDANHVAQKAEVTVTK